MRRILAILIALSAAACTDKRATPPPTVARPVPQPMERGELIGLTGDALAARFGTPALQVPEGGSIKLQFRSDRCVVDAYLYRGTSGEGALRVTHVDTRDKEGRDVDQRGCLTTF